MKNFDNWYKVVKEIEGGKTKDGNTNKGITWANFYKFDWGKYIKKPSDRKTFDNLTDAEAKEIAKNVFYINSGFDKIKAPDVQIIALDTLFNSGNTKSLGAFSYKGFNNLIDSGLTVKDFYNRRLEYISNLKNATGLKNRLNKVYKVALESNSNIDFFDNSESFSGNSKNILKIFGIIVIFYIVLRLLN